MNPKVFLSLCGSPKQLFVCFLRTSNKFLLWVNGWFTALVLSVKKIESTSHNYNSWFLTGLYTNSTTLHKVPNKCSTWAFHVVNLHFKWGSFLNPPCKMQILNRNKIVDYDILSQGGLRYQTLCYSFWLGMYLKLYLNHLNIL